MPKCKRTPRNVKQHIHEPVATKETESPLGRGNQSEVYNFIGEHGKFEVLLAVVLDLYEGVEWETIILSVIKWGSTRVMRI
jgi:hypothetical protein